VGPSGYTFRLDLRAIRRLLDDYFATDFWPIVSSPREGLHFHLILGGKSAVFDAQDRERAARASIDHPTQVDMQTLEEAGHWVHVDDPQGTLAALLAVPW
jgi:pimeloyl-ACP methyl ester carboxylesterase